MIYFFSVVETHDFFNFQKCRWKAIAYLKNKGIPNNEIDGGFEFNGWYKTNPLYPNDGIRSWWWVDKDNYIISEKEITGIATDTIFLYQRYLPYQLDTVFSLARKDSVENRK